MRIVYSFNKRGDEAEIWCREIAGFSGAGAKFIPFNHDRYLDPGCYIRAQLLDNLYYEGDGRLRRMYADLTQLLHDERADALIVDTCPPYHPEFLRQLGVYRVLRIADGPMSAYDRDFAYLHAYDHVLYHSPAYSADMGMAEKLRYCRVTNADFWPLALFDSMHDASETEETLFAKKRDIDIVFIGAMHLGKMPLVAEVKRAFGKRCVVRGLSTLKRNVYFNLKYGFPGWITPMAVADYVPQYHRVKIGFNVHNRGKYTVGGYRLFELPANGVMQISDGGPHLSSFFDPGREVVGYDTVHELIDRLRYYLEHDSEREAIARAGYRRVMRDHRLETRLAEAAELIRAGMKRTGWSATPAPAETTA